MYLQIKEGNKETNIRFIDYSLAGVSLSEKGF
jgi:hypothetical protein